MPTPFQSSLLSLFLCLKRINDFGQAYGGNTYGGQICGGKTNRLSHSTQGLTLIELLVVIVIMGILAAIASTTLFSAATRAKESEAKMTVSTTLRAQQMHYTVHDGFATGFADLEVGIPAQTPHYDYKTHLAQNHTDIDGNQISELALVVAIPKANIRGYMGKVWIDSFNSESKTRSVMCEGDIGATYFMDGKTYCP